MSDKDRVFEQRFKIAIFPLVWLGCFYGFVQSIESTRSFAATAVRVPGRVVELNAGGSHREIEFITKRGERISYPRGGWIGGYRVGDQVTVLYLEDSPRSSDKIDWVGAIWSWPIFLIPFMVGIPLIFFLNNFYKPGEKDSKWTMKV